MSFYKRLVTDYYRLEHVVRAEEWERLCVARERFCFLPLWGLGFPRCRVSGTAILVAGIAVVGLCLLPAFAPRDLSLCCESALWGVSLR